jgi:hypothetical protein
MTAQCGPDLYLRYSRPAWQPSGSSALQPNLSIEGVRTLQPIVTRSDGERFVERTTPCGPALMTIVGRRSEIMRSQKSTQPVHSQLPFPQLASQGWVTLRELIPMSPEQGASLPFEVSFLAIAMANSVS